MSEPPCYDDGGFCQFRFEELPPGGSRTSRLIKATCLTHGLRWKREMVAGEWRCWEALEE